MINVLEGLQCFHIQVKINYSLPQLPTNPKVDNKGPDIVHTRFDQHVQRGIPNFDVIPKMENKGHVPISLQKKLYNSMTLSKGEQNADGIWVKSCRTGKK